LNPLVAEPEQRFGAMLVYGFPDAAHRDEWASDAQRETLQTLQRRLFRRDVIVASLTRVDPDSLPVAPPADAQPASETDAETAAEPPETGSSTAESVSD
jgi:hypothetical protein